MSADVIPIVRPEAVNRAWDTYQAHIMRSSHDRTLLSDREYMEKWARLEREWKRLFWAGEGR